MSSQLHITAPVQPVNCRVALPSSKSISNRVLVIRALSGFDFEIGNLSDAADTVLMQKILCEDFRNLGNPEAPVRINCMNAGTVLRFLAAFLSIKEGDWILEGDDSLNARPIAPLADALTELGIAVEYCGSIGFPPIRITGNPLVSKYHVHMSQNISSQFVSGLLMIGPVIKNGITIQLGTNRVSRPYVEMTLKLMKQFGAQISETADSITVLPMPYQSPEEELHIESDWSSAAFWYQVVALSPGSEVLLKQLQLSGMQGDEALVRIFISLGVETLPVPDGILIKNTGQLVEKPFEYDFNDCPDLVQSVAVTAAALGIDARLTGIRNLRYKETDRIKALQAELLKAGFQCSVSGGDVLLVHSKGRGQLDVTHRELVIETYKDHRMAMAFAPLSLLGRSIIINDFKVVEKSYPAYWQEMEVAGFNLLPC